MTRRSSRTRTDQHRDGAAPVLIAPLLAVLLAVVGGCDETVPSPVPTTLSITNAPTALLAVGDTVRLEVEVRDQYGHPMDARSVDWVSDDPSVATVSASGAVKAVAVGTATITAETGAAAGSVQLSAADPEYWVLFAFFLSTGGEEWTNSSGWMEGLSLGDWYGVDVDSLGRVVGLRLPANNLTGRIPPELGDLVYLETLDLSGNEIGGAIPSEVGELANLTGLDLADNELDGAIPKELGDLAELGWLYLATNELEGPIPPELGSAAALKELRLQDNELSGPVPPELGNLVNLEVMELRSNRLTGAIPAALGELARLKRLNLSDNELSGPIPGALGDLAELEWLWLSHNELDGPIPPELGGLEMLEVLWASHNALSGAVPAELAGALNLALLLIGDNPLTGPLPATLTELSLATFGYANTDLCVPADESFREWLAGIPTHEGTDMECTPLSDREVLEILYRATDGDNWTNNGDWLTDAELGEWYGVDVDASGQVVRLVLSRNQLTGSIPPELGGLANLTELDLHSNELYGSIPPELGSLLGLTYLDLARNRFSGTIPPQLGRLTNLRSLRIWNLTGPIPAELGDLANLEDLILDGFESAGPVPPELGRLSNLKRLAISNSQLSGSIPKELAALTGLEALRLGNAALVGDRLTGSIPPELGSLANLRSLDLGGHSLTGPIPPELGDLSQLSYLSLVRNQLTGDIPAEIGSLERLSRLYLDRNRLTGPIPTELGSLTNLRELSLWFNHLTGPIPPELGGLTNLQELSLWSNRLTGPIPPSLGNLTNLKELVLTRNQLVGPVPSELGGLEQLQELYLSENRLTGNIPPELLQLSRLSSFYFHDNAGLCLPSPSPFRDWYTRILNRWEDGPFCADAEVLKKLYETASGPDWTSADNWLEDVPLDDWYGVDTDSLGLVSSLDLAANGLSGHLPSNLGDLAGLTTLRLGDNALAGPLPFSLANTPMEELEYANTELCVPIDAEFRDWLEAVPQHTGTGASCPSLSDRAILVELYYKTRGSTWTNTAGWATDAPISDWHGVQVDADGSAVGLDLDYNGLVGPIPSALGGLAELRTFSVTGNRLTGPIPPELGALANLEELSLWDNGLTGPIPPELGGLLRLRTLTLARNRLSGPIPRELGGLTGLRSLSLRSNLLWGPIPSELGGMTGLQSLSLWDNQLTGPIPSELGDLGQLRDLQLQSNQLTGPIPSVLGDLSQLRSLVLRENRLAGPIPSELGNLGQLTWLQLQDNRLTGPIPPELGNLGQLPDLQLQNNQLTGPIPSELGNLGELRDLQLQNNRLTGPIPSELGDLAELLYLNVTANVGLAGPLPASFTTLHNLRQLLARNTELCAPREPAFLSWLEGVPDRSVALCVPTLADAYLTQAVQSRRFPVPLVANKPALLRVFLTANATTTNAAADIPPVRATFYVAGQQIHVENIPGKDEPIPAAIDEGSLASSANVEIPSSVIQPGLEVVVEPDPGGTLDPALGVPGRIPETGRLGVDVREAPLFEITVIPFLFEERPDSSILATVDSMAADPDGHELLEHTNLLLPFPTMNLTAHAPVVTSSNHAFSILAHTEMIRVAESGAGHYLGLMAGSTTGPLGVAHQPGWSAFAQRRSELIAHELGHNISLAHAPCAVLGGDDRYPYPTGQIGAWGYDSRAQELVSPDVADLMSYCWPPAWISDYHFTKGIDYRVDAGSLSTAATATRRGFLTRTLIVWGGVDGEGAPFLRPAFYTDAAPSVPPADGAYSLTGRNESGAVVFSLTFDMGAIADAEGEEAGFTFAVPATWTGEMASITLAGPGGSAVLDRDTDLPMTILRDPATGRIRALLEDSPAAAMDGRWQRGDYEVIFTRGIPGEG